MIAAEAGGDELRSCLSDMQCGCDRIADAERECTLDAGSMEALRREGEAEQRAWSCPAAGFAELTEPTDAMRETLGRVERVFGVTGFATCPLYSTRYPWVARIAELYEARKLGLRRDLDPEPALVTVEAMLELDRAIRRRHAREEKKRSDEWKAKHGGGSDG